MITSRRMRWAWHVARIRRKKKNEYRVLVGSQKERGHWEDKDVGEWTILKRILEKQDGRVWIKLIWLKVGISRWLL
jgi:hypothetical protein